MSKFVITTDSAGDLPEDLLKEMEVDCAPLYYTVKEKVYGDKEKIETHEFFELMRKGEMPTTMGCNPDKVKIMFEKALKQGMDILHIAFSSALSVSYNSARIAGEELQEIYPDRKIIVIDSKAASVGQGLVVYKAVQLKNEGKTIDEVAQWVNENLKHVCQFFTVSDLFHLHRGGRVSKTVAVVGTLISVKPILHVDDEGELKPLQNVRGRKKALDSLVSIMKEKSEGFDQDIAFIIHGDCIDEANKVAEAIKKECGVKKVIVNSLSPTIGTHAGPGTVGVFFMGQSRK